VVILLVEDSLADVVLTPGPGEGCETTCTTYPTATRPEFLRDAGQLRPMLVKDGREILAEVNSTQSYAASRWCS
jgi:hypothetical protein